MATYIKLRKFTKEELIFDDEETRIILKFMFKSKRQLVDDLSINDRIREFAQGLLIEAVDASSALGFVEALVRATANPGAGARKVLAKFGRRALKNWFRYAESKDLMQIKIYERVREQLEFNFGRILVMYSHGVAVNEGNHSGFAEYNLSGSSVIWG